MLGDQEKAQLKQEIKQELREEMSSEWTWRVGKLRSGRSIAGLILIIVGVYLILPSFGVHPPPFGSVVLPVLLVLGGISLLRR